MGAALERLLLDGMANHQLDDTIEQSWMLTLCSLFGKPDKLVNRLRRQSRFPVSSIFAVPRMRGMRGKFCHDFLSENQESLHAGVRRGEFHGPTTGNCINTLQNAPKIDSRILTTRNANVRHGMLCARTLPPARAAGGRVLRAPTARSAEERLRSTPLMIF